MANIPHVPLAAETVFHIGSFPIANTFINAFFALCIFVVIALVLKKKMSVIPGRFQNGVEIVLEGILSFFDQVTGDREKSKKFLPIAGTLFFFILLSNWMGLLPGTGSIGVHEGAEFIPILRPANSDLNLTLAMALIAVISSHVMGIVSPGFFTHANKFIQLGSLWKAVKSLKPMGIVTALVEFVVGFIELFSEFAKIASLSLRLFGNIFAGEVLITVIASLVAFLVPLPFMGLEIIVGLVQATVFAMLTLVYLTIMSSVPHGAEHKAAH